MRISGRGDADPFEDLRDEGGIEPARARQLGVGDARRKTEPGGLLDRLAARECHGQAGQDRVATADGI
jgi:hypothetical protein